MKLLLLLFLVLQVNGLISTIINVTLCLNSGENDCSDSCSSNRTALSNLTLSGNNFTLQFCSSEINLEKSVLTIADSHSVQVIGLPTMLTCKYSNTGIHIYNVIDLILQDIELISCGNIYNVPAQQQLDVAEQFISGLYIVDCTGITVDRLKVSGSQGNGVTMFNNDGEITIQNCTFEQNIGYNNSNSVMAGGSGLHIVLSYCGLNNSRPRVCHDEVWSCETQPL